MTGASPETKVDALRELADQFVHEFSNTNPVISLNEFTAKWLAQHITLAQQSAYERAAQAVVKHCGLCEGLSAIRSFGSASALELGLAQARLDEIENHAAHSTRADCMQGECETCERTKELRARIAALSGQAQT